MNISVVDRTDLDAIDKLSTPKLRDFLKACTAGVKRESKQEYSLKEPEYRAKGMTAHMLLQERASKNAWKKICKQARNLKTHKDPAVRALASSILTFGA